MVIGTLWIELHLQIYIKKKLARQIILKQIDAPFNFLYATANSPCILLPIMGCLLPLPMDSRFSTFVLRTYLLPRKLLPAQNNPVSRPRGIISFRGGQHMILL